MDVLETIRMAQNHGQEKYLWLEDSEVSRTSLELRVRIETQLELNDKRRRVKVLNAESCEKSHASGNGSEATEAIFMYTLPNNIMKDGLAALLGEAGAIRISRLAAALLVGAR
ncbi:hypothetical protein R1sor_007946 [Riccia sorocarpa]|uniref:Uncharacterized protein n=1 Tax=Riccia sorocarpa TaxID=122646 RepID=A0ABD3HW19_9MARC